MKLLAVLSSIVARIALPRSLQARLACEKQRKKMAKNLLHMLFLFQLVFSNVSPSMIQLPT
jgi:hypothetical protein